MKKKDMKKLVDAVHVLREYYGGEKWVVELGVVVSDRGDLFRPFRPVKVNGELVSKDNEGEKEDAQLV